MSRQYKDKDIIGDQYYQSLRPSFLIGVLLVFNEIEKNITINVVPPNIKITDRYLRLLKR